MAPPPRSSAAALHVVTVVANQAGWTGLREALESRFLHPMHASARQTGGTRPPRGQVGHNDHRVQMDGGQAP